MTEGAAGGERPAPRAAPLPRAAYRELDDPALMDAMRRGDERAIDEFLIRHRRLLHDCARRWRAARADVEDCLVEVLEDIAVLIVRGRIRPSQSLAGYVAKAFRARLSLRARLEGRRQEVVYGEADQGSNTDERVTLTVSEATARASRAVDWEPSPATPAVARLAAMLDEGLTDEERRILHWLSNFVPQRVISDWLGVSYAAGTQRIWRLRKRLRAAARAHAARFDRHDQLELERFFRRIHDSGEARSTRHPRRGPGAQGGGSTS